MMLNVNVIDDYKEDLTFYNDYVPLRLYPYINLRKRREYLQDKGLFEKVVKKKTKVKRKMLESDKPLEYLHNDFIKWCKSNHEFKELLIDG